MSAPLDLCDWLRTATRGLPAPLKARICDELSAHYQDAYDDARAEGSPASEAHHKALARLGDAGMTAKALRRTHLMRRRYAWAMGAAIAALLWLVMGAVMMGSSLIVNLVAFGFLVVVLRSLRSLLDDPSDSINTLEPTPNTAVVRLPGAFAVIEICTLLVILAGIAGGLDPVHYPRAYMLTDLILFGDADIYAHEVTGIHVLMTVAMAGVGIGWLVISERLIDAGERLHRLAPLLRLAILVNGLAGIAAGIALLMRNSDALHLATIVGITAGFARHTLLILLFYRAAFPQRAHPERKGYT